MITHISTDRPTMYTIREPGGNGYERGMFLWCPQMVIYVRATYNSPIGELKCPILLKIAGCAWKNNLSLMSENEEM